MSRAVEPSEPPAERRQYDVGIESRRRILDAAEALIAERGFDKTSIVEISKRSGVSRGSIPWHFDNKAGVLLALVDRVTRRDLAVDDLRAEDLSPDTVFARYADLVRGGGARLLFAVLSEAVTSTGSVRTQYQQYYADERAKFVAYLEQEGVPLEAREALAAATFSALLGATLQWLIDPEHMDLDSALHEVASMLAARVAQLGP